MSTSKLQSIIQITSSQPKSQLRPISLKLIIQPKHSKSQSTHTLRLFEFLKSEFRFRKSRALYGRPEAGQAIRRFFWD